MNQDDLFKERQALIDDMPEVTKAVISFLMMNFLETAEVAESNLKEMNPDQARKFLKNLAMNLYYAGYAPFIAGILSKSSSSWPALEQLYEGIDQIEFPQTMVIAILEGSFGDFNVE